MVIQPVYNFKHFSVSCENCDMDELISFKSQIRRREGNINKIKAVVPILYRFEPINCIDCCDMDY